MNPVTTYALGILLMLSTICSTSAQRQKGQLKDKEEDTTRPLITKGDYRIVKHHAPSDGKIVLKGKVLNRIGMPIRNKKIGIKVYDGDQLIAKAKTNPEDGTFNIDLEKPKIRHDLKAKFRYVGMGKVPVKDEETDEDLGHVIAPIEAVYVTEALPHEDVTLKVYLGIENAW